MYTVADTRSCDDKVASLMPALYICTDDKGIYLFIYFGFLRCFRHCTGHIMEVSFVGRGNQYIQLVKVLYCKLSTIGKQQPTFPHRDLGWNHRPQRWVSGVLSLHHHGAIRKAYKANIK